jgi:hypothetical protein
MRMTQRLLDLLAAESTSPSVTLEYLARREGLDPCATSACPILRGIARVCLKVLLVVDLLVVREAKAIGLSLGLAAIGSAELDSWRDPEAGTSSPSRWRPVLPEPCVMRAAQPANGVNPSASFDRAESTRCGGSEGSAAERISMQPEAPIVHTAVAAREVELVAVVDRTGAMHFFSQERRKARHLGCRAFLPSGISRGRLRLSCSPRDGGDVLPTSCVSRSLSDVALPVPKSEHLTSASVVAEVKVHAWCDEPRSVLTHDLGALPAACSLELGHVFSPRVLVFLGLVLRVAFAAVRPAA